MNPVFVDAGHWIALLDPGDSLHDTALTASKIHGARRWVTTETVLIEFLNHFAGRGTRSRQQAAQSVTEIRRDPRVQVVPLGPALFDASLHLYATRPDKTWSSGDCVSFRPMRQRKLMDALAYDHHCEQAGFRPLLRHMTSR